MHFVKVALPRAWPMGTAKLFVCVWLDNKKYEKKPSKQ